MDKHSRHMEWLAIGGLIQLQRQIGLQRQSIQQQAAIELNRQRERIIDKYSEELRDRGYSPLEAYNIAINDVNLLELMQYSYDFAQQNQNQIENAGFCALKRTIIAMQLVEGHINSALHWLSGSLVR